MAIVHDVEKMWMRKTDIAETAERNSTDQRTTISRFDYLKFLLIFAMSLMIFAYLEKLN